jgi:DNA-binding CsgD family transcriptional regulator
VRGLLSSQSRHNLTPREGQILDLISRGRSNRDIAEELFISRETVRWHIRTLYAKIGVRDRTEAATYGTRTE